MERLIGGGFARVLAAERSAFNARFAEARRVRPTLDGDAFAACLQTLVAPLVEAIDAVRPDCTTATTTILYDLALNLVGQDLLGPRSREPWIDRGWQRLLPALAQPLAEEPRRVAGAVSNALYTIGRTPGARPAEWIDRMAALAPLAGDVPALLAAGQVAAWAAGLAHYRTAALAIARSLDPSSAARALGLPPETPPDSVASAIDRLAADPWLTPAQAPAGPARERRLAVVRRVGAFRGFGGAFREPPAVVFVAGRFLVGTAQGTWILYADARGATLSPVGPEAIPPDESPESPAPFRLKSGGRVAAGDLGGWFPDLEPVSSWAAGPDTLAVTSSLSHAVTLIAAVPA